MDALQSNVHDTSIAKVMDGQDPPPLGKVTQATLDMPLNGLSGAKELCKLALLYGTTPNFQG